MSYRARIVLQSCSYRNCNRPITATPRHAANQFQRAARCLQVVGCDGVIGSRRRLDRCGVCGGDNSTCHVISGVFTRRRLAPGYNRVASVPAGACDINVTELVFSTNHIGIYHTTGAAKGGGGHASPPPKLGLQENSWLRS